MMASSSGVRGIPRVNRSDDSDAHSDDESLLDLWAELGEVEWLGQRLIRPVPRRPEPLHPSRDRLR